MRLKIVTKEEAYRLIDAIPGNTVMIIQYNGILGISDCGKKVRKWRGKRYIDRSSVVVLSQNDPISMLNLHEKYFNDISDYDRDRTEKIKTILLPKLE